MVDSNRNINTRLNFITDEKGKRDGIRANEELSRATEKRIKKELDLNQDIRKSFKTNIDSLETARKKELEYQQALDKRKQKLDELDRVSSRVRTEVGGLGDVGSAGRTLTGLAGATGINVSGLNIATEIADSIEAFGQLKGALPLAAEGAKQLFSQIGATGAGLIGAFAGTVIGAKILEAQLNQIFTAGNNLIQGTLNARSDLADLINSGASSGEIFQEASNRLKQAISDADQIALLDEAIGRVRNNNSLEGGIAEIVAQFGGSIDLLEKEKTRLETRLNESVRFKQEVDTALQSGQTAQNDAARSALDYTNALTERFQIEQQVTEFAKSASSDALNERLASLQAEKETIQANLETLRPFIISNKEARTQFEALDKRLQSITTETDLLNNSARQTIELRETETEAIEKQKEAQKEKEQIDKQREQSLSKLNALEQQSIDAIEDFGLKLSETTTDRLIRDQQELEDYQIKSQESQQKHQDELLSIQRDGNDKILALQDSIKDTVTSYFDDEIQATRTYRDDLQKLNRDYNKEQKRELEDHLKTLRGAARDNNVLAFLEEQDRFKTDSKRRKEDKDDSVSQLEAQFQAERDLRKKEFEARQADLQAEIEQVRTQTQEKLAESQRAFETEQRQADEARNRALERQRQADELIDKRNREALQRRLNEINQQAQAEITAIQQVTRAVGELVSVANRIAVNAGQTQTRTVGTSYGGGTPLGQKSYEIKNVGGQRVATAFADGGISTSPTLSLTGEVPGRGDLIIPFNKSEGIMPAIRRLSGQTGKGIQIYVNNPVIGDIANMEDVYTVVQLLADKISQQLPGGIATAIHNPRIAS